MARNTVRSALASDTPPRYSRPARASMFEEYEPRVRELLGDVPSMPATVLAHRVGWTGSASHFREKVAAIKSQLAVADPADRLFFDAGELFWAKRQTLTDAAHVDSARRLRAMFKEQQRERAGSGHRDRQLAVAQRPLSDYDNLFDVDFSLPGADGQVA